ncbi:uncharacterized protein BP01DRAFT_424862 [Aspergillus saccharolyticus JOP 1030-1]|uniref:Transcription factor domain-containing protein n=1 Tax=Aspergillus saccharolyticus JOP 1030-1 TaxID=1450539 RepID=A0A318Z8K5_9EURO|nr:hypothetical protein BP01DRAFT_424862 [Aspergillus saccharolyticus JOP 1030-1]PYH43586.1 hypothetical protein BP01DRAFT_424862 [Aspergillus saccharolyticus JOP 1030-1]
MTTSGSSWVEQRGILVQPQPIFVGRTKNSPIHLLNSKLEATVLDQCLASIYNIIVRDSASRFVDYECNLSASSHRYYLESRSSQTGLEGADEDQFTQSATATTTGTQFPRMTMLGVVRFLDHFSHLYGNRLGTTARKQADTALKAVLRAFSLQWLPASRPSSEVSSAGQDAGRDALIDTFHHAWMEARTLIQGSLSILSFRLVCAILLFDGIVIPSKAHGGSGGTTVSMHEFLNIGLQKLSRVDDLVRKYCCQLGPTSLYGTLFHSSLDILRWGGYIRDIGAALFTDHRCKLPELSSSTTVSPEINPSLPFPIKDTHHMVLDGTIPRIYRMAVARAFFIWQRITKVKYLVQSTIHDNSHSVPFPTLTFITTTMTMVDEYNNTLRPFMSQSMEKYADLSTEFEIYALSVLTFWNLGTLILARTLTPLLLHPPDNRSSHDTITAAQLQALQRTAVISIAQTIERTLTQPSTHDTFNLQNGLSADLPLLAYHITPSLVVLALRLAIETSIELWLGVESGATHNAGSGGNDDDDVWQKRVDVLVKGLLSLEVTIGGSQAVGPVLDALLRKYGDVVSECWTCEFST